MHRSLRKPEAEIDPTGEAEGAPALNRSAPRDVHFTSALYRESHFPTPAGQKGRRPKPESVERTLTRRSTAIFLTDNGTQFTYWGWTSMARRIRERMQEAGFEGFMQHRARGSTAKLLQRRGVPLNVIQQIGGWEGPEMVRRYIGDYSVEELKTFPTVGLDQILVPDKDRGLPQAS